MISPRSLAPVAPRTSEGNAGIVDRLATMGAGRDPGAVASLEDAAACPDVAAIMAYVEGDLGPVERDRMDAHIDACADCAALVAHAVRERDVAASGAEETPYDPLAPWPERSLPTRVGRYVVLESIGRGGMGVVCAAYDPRLRRNVAVKLLRPDRNDPDASARLRREARALATLSHPNVVSVFECGVLDDRDGNYVVMELVVGETLRRWCDRTRPTPSEIVTAYLAAARGLAAAHAAGLVHRDFKPDNVLVGIDGRICVTDFGLARVVTAPTGRGDSDASASGSTSHRGSASDDAGTPMYMAPEQRDGALVGPAADQYAFCVSLWEALAGAYPPAGDPGRIPSRLRAALLRGLSPDPSARWPDMDALARVVARTRGATAARGIAAVAGIALTVGVAQWALDRRALADEHCTSTARRMDDAWGGDRRDTVVALARGADAPEVVDALDDWSERWRARAARACTDEPELVQDGGCLSLAAVELETLVDLLERAPRLDPVLRAAVHDLDAPEACSRASANRVDLLTAAAVRDRLARATALEVSHRFDGALSLAAEAVALAREVDDALLAEALSRQARILHDAGNYRGEAESAEEAYLIAESVGDDELAAQVATSRVFTTAQIENDYASAKTWARHAEAAVDRLPTTSRELASARLDVARAHIDQGEGRIDDAIRRVSGALERFERRDDVPPGELSGVYNDHGALVLSSDPDAALASFGQALALIRGHYGDAHPRAAMLLSNIAGVYYNREDYELAARSFDEAARLLETVLGEHHSDVAGAYMNLALAQQELGDELAARASLARALEIFTVSLGPDHPDVAMARTNLGAFELATGDLDAAEAAFRQSLATLEATVGPEHVYCTNALHGLAEVALARGRADEAVTLRARALAIAEAQDTAPAELASDRLALAEAQAKAGDREAGEATVRAAIAALAATRDRGDPEALAQQLAELDAWLLEDRRLDRINAEAGGSG